MDKITTVALQKMKASGKKITMLTAYDYLLAGLLDASGIDILMVGDSLGMITLGYENTLPVTMEDMISHTAAVARAAKRAMVIGDLPFMSYQVSVEQGLANAGRLVKEGQAHGVKIEGGAEVLETIEKITSAGIPVMGHLGLTPQSIHQFGGYNVRASEDQEAEQLLKDAKALEEAGVFSIVLEKIPTDLAKRVTESVATPTIGIGAGIHCDGQVLVTHDLLGMFTKFVPKFVKRYADLAGEIDKAAKDYIKEVQEGKFPGKEHSF